MAFYQGTETTSRYIDKIVSLLTTAPSGSTEPFWRKVQSGTYANEGYILKSTGSSGTDKIFIRITQPANQGIQVSAIENYEPNAVDGLNGTITNESVKVNVNWSQSAGYPSTFPVGYWLSFDKDRIMLAVIGDKTYTYSVKTFMWLGLPERIAAEKDSTGVLFAVSQWAASLTNYTTHNNLTAGQCRVSKGKTRANWQTQQMITLSRFPTRGWGGKVILPDIFIASIADGASEGLRSKMHGVHPLILSSVADFRDGDEITVGSKRYTVHYVYSAYSTSNTNCFPQHWLAVEQLS